MVVKDLRNTKAVTKVLLSRPEKAEGFLAELEHQYYSKYGQAVNTSNDTK